MRVRPGRQNFFRRDSSRRPSLVAHGAARAQRAQRGIFLPASRSTRAAGKGGRSPPCAPTNEPGLKRSLSDRQVGEMPTKSHVWAVSALRMKAKLERRVPLCGVRSRPSTRRGRSLTAATSCSPCGAGRRCRRRRCPVIQYHRIAAVAHGDAHETLDAGHGRRVRLVGGHLRRRGSAGVAGPERRWAMKWGAVRSGSRTARMVLWIPAQKVVMDGGTATSRTSLSLIF